MAREGADDERRASFKGCEEARSDAEGGGVNRRRSEKVAVHEGKKAWEGATCGEPRRHVSSSVCNLAGYARHGCCTGGTLAGAGKLRSWLIVHAAFPVE